MRRALVVGGSLVVVALLAAGGVLWPRLHDGSAAAAPTPSAGQHTVTVTRTDLADTQLVPGVVGFGTPTSVIGHGSGIVTALPAPGTVVDRGQTLYRIDDQPVTLFVGTTPFFRTLSVTPPRNDTTHGGGSGGGGTPPVGGPVDAQGRPTGGDVAVLKENLTALGYSVGAGRQPVYTTAVAAAVTKWQKAVGLPATGVFDPVFAVVFPTAVRVDSVPVAPGADATGEVLKVTSTTRTISVTLTPVQGAAFPVGTAVTVLLADGTRVPAKVAATTTKQAQDGSAQVQGTIAPDDPTALDATTSDAVRVQLTGQTRSGVLAVPVSALLALAGGGYGLQEPDGTLLRVTTGLFAGGLVEVSGRGVAAGLQVVDAQ